MPKRIPKEIAHKVTARVSQHAVELPDSGCIVTKSEQVYCNGEKWTVRYCVWSVFNATIPENHHVLPKCGNKLCINPEHLALTRPNCNFLDCRNHYHRSQAKNRQFSEAETREILEYAKNRKPGNPDKIPHLMIPAMAKRFRCSKSVIQSILSGRRYKFVAR